MTQPGMPQEMVWDMYDSTGLVRTTVPTDQAIPAALGNAREDNPVYFLSAGGDGYEDQGPFRLTVVRDEE